MRGWVVARDGGISYSYSVSLSFSLSHSPSIPFTVGLVMCTPGGEIVIDIVDHYTSTYCLLVIGILECVMVGWVYDLYPVPVRKEK